ncbi:MAG: phosphopantetheine-binding protein [Deltaproteobacteria bacterium]|jgi:acyl carrier protein|nr:phosphopantetheine-binding protein [Deltaproteobacteria bacterium]MDL1986510.1 phosphopantetheine-binding protein [Deltaproteobacteria bacterium]
MDILEEIKKILAEILDIENHIITPETYLIRELGAESIDLLELAVAINSRFNIDVNDDEIFLRKLRQYVTEAKQQNNDLLGYLVEKLPFLSSKRLENIIADLEGGPTLKVKDIISYIDFQINNFTVLSVVDV